MMLEEVKEKEEDFNELISEPKTCWSTFNRILDIFFGKRPQDVGADEVPGNVFSYLGILVSFLQQLSLLNFDGLDFGTWGDIFGNIDVFSLNIGNPFQNVNGEILYMMGVFISPYVLHIWWLRAHQDTDGWTDKYPKVNIFSWIVFVTSTITSIVLLTVVSVEAFSIAVFPAGVILLTKIFFKIRFFFIGDLFDKSIEGYDKRRDFHSQEKSLISFLIGFALPIITGVLVNFAFLNDDKALQIIFSIFGTFTLILFLFRVVVQVTGSLRWKYSKQMVKITHNWFIYKRYIYINKAPGIRKQFVLMPFFLVVEKLLLAALPAYVLSVGEEDDVEIVDYVVAVLVFLGVIFFFFFGPYGEGDKRDKQGNLAETVSRLSNFFIFVFAIANTRLLDDDKSEKFELYSSIIMIIISGYMTIFWLRLLDIRELVTIFYESTKSTINDNLAKFKWRKVKSVENAAAIILARDDQQVTEIEWKILSHIKKMYTACVERTLTLSPEQEIELTVEDDGKIDISFETPRKLPIFDVIRKYGFSKVKNLQALHFVEYEDEFRDFRILADSGMLLKLNKNGLREFGVAGRNLQAEDLEYFMKTLEGFENVEVVDLISLAFNEEDLFSQAHVDAIITSTVNLESLKKFAFQGTMIPDDFAIQMITAFIPVLHNLEFFHFGYCHVLTDSVLECLFKHINEKENSPEGCKIEKIHVGNNKFSEAMIQKTMDFLAQSKCVSYIDLTQRPDMDDTINFSEFKNEYYEFCEQNPGKILMQEESFLASDETREDCNVFFDRIVPDEEEVDDWFGDESEGDFFLNEEKFNDKVTEEVEFGNCRVLSLGIQMLNDEWLKVAQKVITSQEMNFEDDEGNRFECSLPEAIVRAATGDGKHTAHVLMVLNRDLGVDYSELKIKEDENGKSIADFALESDKKYVKSIMEKFMEKKHAGDSLTDADLK